MFKDIEASQLIELLNYIKANQLDRFQWLYKLTLQELCRRQPYIAKTYMYKDLFSK